MIIKRYCLPDTTQWVRGGAVQVQSNSTPRTRHTKKKKGCKASLLTTDPSSSYRNDAADSAVRRAVVVIGPDTNPTISKMKIAE